LGWADVAIATPSLEQIRPCLPYPLEELYDPCEEMTYLSCDSPISDTASVNRLDDILTRILEHY